MNLPRVEDASPSFSESNSPEDISFSSEQFEDSDVSQSTFASTYTDSSKNKRQRLHSSTYDSKFHVPRFVSSWKLYHAERLHIFYSKCYIETPDDLFGLLDNSIKPLTDQQKYYIERIKSLLKFDSGQRGPWSRETFYAETCNRLNGVLDEIISDLHSIFNSGNNIDALVSHRVFEFVKELSMLLKKFQIRFSDGKDISGTYFIPVFQSFAQMCNLTVQSCGLESKWHKLADQRVVSSIPHLRFFQKGKNFDEFILSTSQILASVVGTKRDSWQRSEEPPVRLIRCSDDKGEDYNRPEILKDLSESVLGQHAGVLLLEIRQNHVRKIENGVGKFLTPGMIIDGTKVFFTLLEMTSNHMEELNTKKEYESHMDNATIYYVKPLDLIFKDDRDILIDSIMMLNNIEFPL